VATFIGARIIQRSGAQPTAADRRQASGFGLYKRCRAGRQCEHGIKPALMAVTSSAKNTRYFTLGPGVESVTPIWENAGDTPTRNMHNHINIRIFDRPLPDNWKFPDLWGANIPSKDRLPIPLGAAPKGRVRGQKVGISIEQMREIVAGTKRLYMWGWRRLYAGTEHPFL
jgi:hypothetical protein